MRLFYLVGIFVVFPASFFSQKGPIKDGFYKVVNVGDGAVLTATMSKERPRVVITSPWIGSDEQEWKVKTKLVDQVPMQIIRNEKIRDNEVTKERNRDKASNKNDYVQTLWNLITVGNARGGGFELNNGQECLRSNGIGKEIEYVPCLDSEEEDVEDNYLWKFEYLYDIPKNEATIE